MELTLHQNTRHNTQSCMLPFPERILPNSSQTSQGQQPHTNVQQQQQLNTTTTQHDKPYFPTLNPSSKSDNSEEDMLRPTLTRIPSYQNEKDNSMMYMNNPRAVPQPRQNNNSNYNPLVMERILPVDTRTSFTHSQE